MGMERSMEQSRTKSDTELIRGGAEQVTGKDGSRRLEATDEQIESARKEMEQDLAVKYAERMAGDTNKGEAVRASIEDVYKNETIGISAKEQVVAQGNESDAQKAKNKDALSWGKWFATVHDRKEKQKTNLKIMTVGGLGLAGISAGSAAAGLTAGATALAAPLFIGGGLAVAVGGAAWYGWKRLKESFKQNDLMRIKFSPEEKIYFEKGKQHPF